MLAWYVAVNHISKAIDEKYIDTMHFTIVSTYKPYFVKKKAKGERTVANIFKFTVSLYEMYMLAWYVAVNHISKAIDEKYIDTMRSTIVSAYKK